MKIEQVDRDAAGAYLRSEDCPLNAKMTIKPQALIEAFARHRIRALEDALEDALTPSLIDFEIEEALTSEGIFTWGPDGECFERMFAVVMNLRAHFLQPADEVEIPATTNGD